MSELLSNKQNVWVRINKAVNALAFGASPETLSQADLIKLTSSQWLVLMRQLTVVL